MMRHSRTARPLPSFAAAVLVVLVACFVQEPQEAPDPLHLQQQDGTSLSGSPSAVPLACPAPTVEVTTAAQLRAALDTATPGTVIGLADGIYDGTFAATTTGTAEAPIWMCGGPNAVLRGPGTDEGIVLHLQQVHDWRVVGFTVREGQKGVMADGTSDSVFQGLTVTEIGDEGVHLRTNSTDNVVRGLTVSDTGLRRVKFGEGIYVGSAQSNWCQISECQPDRSDRNIIVDSHISATAAESVDIKEGTSAGVLAGNTFDGTGMRGEADSWVDVKGNGWLVRANRGTTAATSGFQVNVQAEGWGRGNTFDANTADVRGPGYGYELREGTDGADAGNRVLCTNTATAARSGLTNATCTEENSP